MCKTEVKDYNQFNGLISVANYFKDEKVCLRYVEEWLWGGNIRCIQCGDEKPYRYKDGVRFKCRNCKTGFTAKVGTMFHSSKIPLQKWFMAMYLMACNKKGISSCELARQLEITQKSSWYILQRIRGTFKQMPEGMLDGIIEIDEAFVGGKNKNRHKDKKIQYDIGRDFKDKTPVMGMFQRGGELRTFVVPDVKAVTLKALIRQQIAKGSTIYSDDWNAYKRLPSYYKHESVDHGRGQYKNGDACTNKIEGFWSHLKRMIIGVYNWVSPKHLQRYVDEITFRFNNRDLKNGERFRLMFNFIECRIRYKDLTKPVYW